MVRRCASTRSGRTLARTGTPLKQIARGGTCHLDAPTIARALARRALATIDLLFVETVGNLPTSFDLGEDMKIVAAERQHRLRRRLRLFPDATMISMTRRTVEHSGRTATSVMTSNNGPLRRENLR
jgi:hypothetical protein